MRRFRWMQVDGLGERGLRKFSSEGFCLLIDIKREGYQLR